ncbi:MAG: CPBP family intramembrane glutamic endopeptidase [Bacteroidales bacterium]
MIRTIFRTSSPGTKILLFGFILITCIFLSFPFIQLGVRLLGYNPGVLQNLDTGNIVGHLDLFRLLQIVQSFFFFVLPPLVFAWLVSENTTEYLSLRKAPRVRWLWGILVLVIIAVPALNLIAEMNSKMAFPDFMQSTLKWMTEKEKEAEMLTENYLGVPNLGGLLFNLFMIALLPAVGEELLFRGILQRLLSDLFRNRHWGIWISALLFTSLHLQFLTMVPRLLLGALFGYLLLWSRTLWLPIAAHFINNAMAVIFYWLWHNGYSGKEIDEIGTMESSIIPAVISLLLVAVWMFWFYRDSKKDSQISVS